MDRSEKEQRSDDEADYEDEEVDPRIQGELEKLNQSTDDINRCETELEDARQKFRSVLVEATVKLDEMVKKIGKPVEESKPYWEARRLARQAQLEAQKATQDFHRATEVLRAAKETISLAEQRLLEEDNRQFDSAWQEMLNHATQRVMEAEHTKTRSELLHKETAAKYTAAISRMKQLEKKLKRTISKSKPYFEMKAKCYLQLENLKKNVDERQAKLSQAKGEYRTALKNLEMISDEIHERRRSSTIGPRRPGVGAEGDSSSGDDVSSFKMESDGISIVSFLHHPPPQWPRSASKTSRAAGAASCQRRTWKPAPPAASGQPPAALRNCCHLAPSLVPPPPLEHLHLTVRHPHPPRLPPRLPQLLCPGPAASTSPAPSRYRTLASSHQCLGLAANAAELHHLNVTWKEVTELKVQREIWTTLRLETSSQLPTPRGTSALRHASASSTCDGHESVTAKTRRAVPRRLNRAKRLFSLKESEE
ncbi:SH3 domain-binding protein 5b isoform 1-T1 [Anableps anableps]